MEPEMNNSLKSEKNSRNFSFHSLQGKQEFEFKAYELERCGKHHRLLKLKNSHATGIKKEYILVLKGKLKQTCTNKTHNQAHGH